MPTPPDALAAVLRWLTDHPDLPVQLRDGGAPTGKARVSGGDGGRYPWLRIQDTPAGAGGIQWDVNSELMVELLDAPERHLQLSRSAQKRLLQECLWLVAELEHAEQPIPGRTEVVSAISAGAGPALVSDTAAPTQPRWLATVSVNAHPAP